MTTEPITIKAECLKRLSVIDKSFLQIEDETQLMTVAGAWVFEEAPDLDLLRADLARWVGMFPVFKSRLNGDLWEESPDFDIEQHFTVSTLPGPGGKQELEAYLGQLMSLPFDLSRPLWRANLIQGFNGKGAVYFVALHHCISDGQGAIRMVLSLTTSSEEEKISGAGHTMKPKHERSHAPHDGKKPRFNHRFIKPIRHRVASLPKGEQLVGAFQQLHVFTFLALLFTFLDAFFFRLFALLHMALKWVMFVISPKKVFIKEGGTQKQVAYSDLLDLEEVKAVGRACGATLNDVLMANLTSTVRKYLQSTGELHKEKELSCIVPASVRAPEDWQLGNKVCILLLQLPIHIEDPIERLKEVKKRLDEIKAANEVSISYFSMLVGLRLVPKFIFEPLVQIFTRKYHILLTNVPGPRHEISFAGRTVKEYYTFVPQPSKGGLGLCVLSYNGKVSLSVNSDLGHITPNSGSLLKEFKQEFEILKQRVLGASPTAPETSVVENQETSLETPAAASDVKVERAQSPQADSGFHSEKDSGSDSE